MWLHGVEYILVGILNLRSLDAVNVRVVVDQLGTVWNQLIMFFYRVWCLTHRMFYYDGDQVMSVL